MLACIVNFGGGIDRLKRAIRHCSSSSESILATMRVRKFRLSYTSLIIVVLATSLDEIGDVIPYGGGEHYFVVKNFLNEASFFEWKPTVYTNYFKMVKNAAELTIPKLNEMAYEHVELSGVPFATFIADRTMQGQPGNYWMVLRGYVRTWLNQVCAEYNRVALLDRIYDRASAQ
jgi:hypothetical protein